MSKNISKMLTVGGAEIPTIGYGTMLFPEPDRAVELILHALKIGYRHIDTARKYGSEKWVGEALRASGLSREDVWITTKVTEENARADDFALSVNASLDALGLDYVDLLLIHWPQPRVPLEETLEALAKAKREGLTRHIGLSNFTVSLLDEAVAKCTEPLLTNQIEYHAYLCQDKLVAACQKHNLFITCHAPLARGAILNDPLICDIAERLTKTPAQIALRWLVQQSDISVVPRALEITEIDENIDVFDFTLSDADMASIRNLSKNNLRIVDPIIRRPVWDEN